jgi:hypothetical protein
LTEAARLASPAGATSSTKFQLPRLSLDQSSRHSFSLLNRRKILRPRSLKARRPKVASLDAGKAPDTRLRELRNPQRRPISVPNLQRPIPPRAGIHSPSLTDPAPASACLQACCVTTASLELAGQRAQVTLCMPARPCHPVILVNCPASAFLELPVPTVF